MENDNIKRDEDLQEGHALEETVTQESVAEEKTEEETVLDKPLVEEAQEIVEEIELTEEDLAKIEALKKKERKRNIIIASVAALVVALVAFFACYTEGVGTKSIVNGSGLTSETETSFWAKLKNDNIRFENPLVTAFEKIVGLNKDSAMKINGIAVDKDVLNFVANSSGINCAYSLIQTGMVTDINNFDWEKVDEQIGLSYLELSKSMAVETLIPIYATIAEGEKRGVEFTDEDDKKIKDWIAQQKQNYGADFEDVLVNSGYADETTLYEVQKIQLHMQKVYEDIEKNPSKYITDSFKNKLSDDKVTVKHILIGFEQSEDGTVSDDAKAKAKKTAEEVLEKVKSGDDFDALVKTYNTDPGATEQGYTFAQDGSMVKEFEDASFALKIGETSELVETTYGYHIIKRIERNITADDYIAVLQKTAPVNIKKGVYNKIKITIDLRNYFGSPIEN